MKSCIKELNNNQTMICLVEGIKYSQETVFCTKELAKKKILYVTLNKTSASLKEVFKKKKISTKNMTFIDCITRTLSTVKNTEDTIYLSSPGALTEIALTISEHLKKGYDYLVFDSLNNLLIYEKKAPVAKFVSSIVGKIKLSDTKAVFFGLDTKEPEKLIEQASMYVDKVVKIK